MERTSEIVSPGALRPEFDRVPRPDIVITGVGVAGFEMNGEGGYQHATNHDAGTLNNGEESKGIQHNSQLGEVNGRFSVTGVHAISSLGEDGAIALVAHRTESRDFPGSRFYEVNRANSSTVLEATYKHLQNSEYRANPPLIGQTREWKNPNMNAGQSIKPPEAIYHPIALEWAKDRFRRGDDFEQRLSVTGLALSKQSGKPGLWLVESPFVSTLSLVHDTKVQNEFPNGTDSLFGYLRPMGGGQPLGGIKERFIPLKSGSTRIIIDPGQEPGGMNPTALSEHPDYERIVSNRSLTPEQVAQQLAELRPDHSQLIFAFDVEIAKPTLARRAANALLRIVAPGAASQDHTSTVAYRPTEERQPESTEQAGASPPPPSVPPDIPVPESGSTKSEHYGLLHRMKRATAYVGPQKAYEYLSRHRKKFIIGLGVVALGSLLTKSGFYLSDLQPDGGGDLLPDPEPSPTESPSGDNPDEGGNDGTDGNEPGGGRSRGDEHDPGGDEEQDDNPKPDNTPSESSTPLQAEAVAVTERTWESGAAEQQLHIIHADDTVTISAENMDQRPNAAVITVDGQTYQVDLDATGQAQIHSDTEIGEVLEQASYDFVEVGNMDADGVMSTQATAVGSGDAGPITDTNLQTESLQNPATSEVSTDTVETISVDNTANGEVETESMIAHESDISHALAEHLERKTIAFGNIDNQANIDTFAAAVERPSGTDTLVQLDIFFRELAHAYLRRLLEEEIDFDI